jgi:uncharacterized protein
MAAMHRRLTIGVLAVLAAAAAARGANDAPSFDCAKASTSDERAICSDPRLSELDRAVAAAYASARSQVGAEQVTEKARDLLASRRACGDNKLCILHQQLRAIAAYRAMGITVPDPDWAVTYRDRLIGALRPDARLPRQIGQCVTTIIARISDRGGGELATTLTQDVDPGTAVEFANGGYQVSYERESVIARSRVGDRVRMCLVSIPKDCPPGDERGRVYTTTNLRTGEAWRLADAQHMCGGA